MTPKFAKAVDPIFLYVLDLLDRINARSASNPVGEKQSINGLLSAAQATLGQRPDWELTLYAMVSWIDEMLIEQ